nr:MAG TPA: hypothetical protein [Caudoviricetes sp.]
MRWNVRTLAGSTPAACADNCSKSILSRRCTVRDG